jgi:hypothetical protein
MISRGLLVGMAMFLISSFGILLGKFYVIRVE